MSKTNVDDCASSGRTKLLIKAVKINKEIIKDKDYILHQELLIKELNKKTSILCLCWKKDTEL